MMQSILATAAALTISTSAALAQDITLKVGDKAPALEHVEWIKGEEVLEFEEDHIYVLDFWATWCGPCVASIPHINELQQKYREDNVHVIGVAIWGSQNNEQFVEARGDGMDYRVAVDQDDKTAEAYMRASGQQGIPTVMLVDGQGEIAWIGHPMMGLDTAVELMVKDEFTQERMAEEMDRIAKEEQERQAKLAPVMQRAQEALTTEDWPAAETALIELVELEPTFLPRVAGYVYVAKVKQGNDEDAKAYAMGLMEDEFKGDSNALNGLAWGIVAPVAPLEADEVDADVAIALARRASEIENHANADVLDTLARAYFIGENIDMAVKTQKRAVALDEENVEFANRLREYEEAAASS